PQKKKGSEDQRERRGEEKAQDGPVGPAGDAFRPRVESRGGRRCRRRERRGNLRDEQFPAQIAGLRPFLVLVAAEAGHRKILSRAAPGASTGCYPPLRCSSVISTWNRWRKRWTSGVSRTPMVDRKAIPLKIA